MQTTIGSLLNTPPASSSETVGSAQSDAGAAFSAIYAREMQQSGVADGPASQASQDLDEQPDQAPLPSILVEEQSLDEVLLADVWAILEEVAPLQDVAGTTGVILPDELTSRLVDAAFELGRLADELSSALVQKPIYDARGLDPAVITAALSGSQGVNGVTASYAALAERAKSLDSGSLMSSLFSTTLPSTTLGGDSEVDDVGGLPVSSLVTTAPGLSVTTAPISQAITEVLNRVRSLLAASGQNNLPKVSESLTAPLTAPLTVPLTAPLITPLAGSLTAPLNTEVSTLSAIADLANNQNASGSQLAAQRSLSSGLDTLQTLNSVPTAITALLTALAGQIDVQQSSGSVTAMPVGTDLDQLSDEVLSLSPADLIRLSLANDKSLKSLTLDQAVNDVADVETLLDEGFRIQDIGTAILRESNALSAAGGSTLDSLIRSGAPTESRSPDALTNAAPQSNADKTTQQTEQRPTVATARSDVWLRSTDELPDHILAHVGRMHAQSIRFNAAGFGDLVQRMTLSLHPEALGQVDVQMRSGEQMSLVFHAREGATRDLLEQNIARLRQMFEAQGISLGDISVGTGGANDRRAHDETSNALLNQFSPGGAGTGPDRPSAPRSQAASDRLIDTRA